MAPASGPTPANTAATPNTAPVTSNLAAAPSTSSADQVGPESPAPNGLSGSSSGAPGAATFHPGLRLAPTNGPHKDGRVRNPIPSKLKGKTDENKGNFNVMHMDISNTAESQARYDAAKRNSESTFLQAKMAETDHYVSHHRRANYVRPRPLGKSQFAAAGHPTDEASPESLAVPTATATATERETATAPAPATANAAEPSRPLTAEETKAEQARLLTLLRSLNPVNVVDQICKGLAYFGGIPDIRDPTGRIFPESAHANGSGSLFVGWIAEIFPDLERPRRREPPVVTLQPAPPPRRPRGRPKGSKASKIRKDKGLKKGSKLGELCASLGIRGDSQQHGQDESWVDVDDDVMEAEEDADAVERRVLNLLGGTATPPRALDPGAANATPATGSTTGFTSINNASADAPASLPAPTSVSASAKRRGRPKGSKNRPKDAAAQSAPRQIQGGQAPITAMENPTVPAVEGQAKKPNTGRPKGTKNKPQGASDPTTQQPSAAPTSTSYIPPPTFPSGASSSAIATQSSAANGAAAVNNRRAGISAQSAPTTSQPTLAVSQTATVTTQSFTPHVKESAIVGVKRKRQSNKAAGAVTNGDGNSPPRANNGSTPQLPLPSTSALMNPTAMASQTQTTDTSFDQSSASVPPAKRARKSNAKAPKRQSVTTNASSSATINDDSTPSQSQPAMASQNHSPTEALDGHYDMFQNQPYRNKHQPPSNGQRSPEGGLSAHLARFENMNSRQAGQNASPTPSQMAKAPSMNTAPSSHQQHSRVTPNYYAQNQTPSYTTQQGSAYAASQRMSSGSPGTTLVSHVTHSPQFGATGNNSPLMGTDTSFRGSPSMHSNQNFAPRRTPSASSPMDNAANYRTNNSTTFGSAAATRQTSTANSNFQPFPDTNYLEMQGLGDGSGNSHNSMGLGSNAYGLNGTTSQRTNGSGNASAFATAAVMSTGYRAQQQQQQHRWS